MANFPLLLVVMLVAAMFPSASSECKVVACQSQIPTNGTVHERCRMAKEAITCAQDTLLSNPDCSEDTKRIVRERVVEGRRMVKETCGGSFLTSSLVLCLALTGVANFLTSFK